MDFPEEQAKMMQRDFIFSCHPTEIKYLKWISSYLISDFPDVVRIFQFFGSIPQSSGYFQHDAVNAFNDFRMIN